MAQQTERAVLNHLIEMCRDGEKGFENAAAHVTDGALRDMFAGMAQQRQAFAEELLPHAHVLGGASESEGSRVARLHRAFTNLKGKLSGHSDLAIVEEAERGEDAALEAYRDALEGVLPPAVRGVVERQCADVQKSRDRVYEIDKSQLAGD